MEKNKNKLKQIARHIILAKILLKQMTQLFFDTKVIKEFCFLTNYYFNCKQLKREKKFQLLLKVLNSRVLAIQLLIECFYIQSYQK